MVALFSSTLLLSAALVFLVQPMFAKFVLPLYGSTPAVWNTSLVFFQTALLLAYLYAHVSTRRLGVRRQAAVHIALVLVPLLLLPIAVPDGFEPPAEGDPVLSLLGLLAVAVGLPFFVVSATAPLLQRWLASTDHPAAADPYFLYRASNLGSVIGLLGYPLAMEANLALDDQGWAWSGAYLLLTLLLLACAVSVWRARRPSAQDASQAATGSRAEPLPARRRLRWVGLAFVPSSLMLGVTAFLTIDIAPLPLLWALPLALYLASFVFAFSPTARAARLHGVLVIALPGFVLLLLILLLVEAQEPLWLVMPLHLLGFFVAAMVCHGELARDRPPTDSLTAFYLLISLGGALGGLFTGIVVPALVDSLPEYGLALVLACFCLPWRKPRVEPGPYARRLDFALPVAVGAVVAIALALVSLGGEDLEGAGLSFAFGLGAGVALNFVRRPLRFGLTIAAMALAGVLLAPGRPAELHQERSFFGVYRVTASEDGKLHNLVHGTTIHGAQDVSPERRREPLTYFHPTGPVGQVIAALPPRLTRRTAVIGLGTGSMACHSKPGDRWTFYELDPTVEGIARDPALFSYLRDCAGRFDVVPGDARLSLEDAGDRTYGVMVADAFSSDAIPIHLLTREALRLYRAKLRDDGVLAFHISNRFLELEPVLGDLARDARVTCRAQQEPSEARGKPRGKIPSHWVAIASSDAELGALANDPRWAPCARSDDPRVWTDDFSNPLGTLSLG